MQFVFAQSKHAFLQNLFAFSQSQLKSRKINLILLEISMFFCKNQLAFDQSKHVF